jgi:hypothetical protein
LELGTLEIVNWKLGMVDWRWQMVTWCEGVSGMVVTAWRSKYREG